MTIENKDILNTALGRPGKVLGYIAETLRKFGVSSLLQRDQPVANTRQVIGWWEARRIPYNLIVGSAGILTCTVFLIIEVAAQIFFNSDFGLPDPPIFAVLGIFIYGILANACFTFGWLTEIFVRKIWPEESDRFATTTFLLGLIFSVLLTLIPAVIIGAAGIFELFSRIFGIAHR